MKSYIKDYPRPQLVRSSWVNLNGTWDFAFDDKNVGEQEKWYQAFPQGMPIIVPFTYETALSGIADTAQHWHVWYRRCFKVNAEVPSEKRLLLHFEGVDYTAQVWINGKKAGSHTGGYARFSLDITDLVQPGENILTVKADDSFDRTQPRGKQRWTAENFACWYVQNTGIWKTVWMEYVPKAYISGLKLTPDLQNGEICIDADVTAEDYPQSLTLTAEVSFGGETVNCVTAAVTQKQLKIKVSLCTALRGTDSFDIHTWGPGHPNLYDLSLRLCRDNEPEDLVLSYFGMREIQIEGNQVLLNGAALYQRLILDQGYWKDSLLTPPDEAALIEDIDKVQQLGYNGVRKHQKVEDERFLYWADVKGLLVWSEAPAAFVYNDEAIQRFTTEWMEIVRQNYSHPAIITWTPINESWGVPKIKTDFSQQRFTEAIYNITKAFDPTRPVIVNDGWEHTVSDIITLHDYQENARLLFEHYTRFEQEILEGKVHFIKDKAMFADGYGYRGQPIIISEYGGFAYDSGEAGWGYGESVKTEEEYLKRFDDITSAIRSIPYICGFCFTQVTDVQQEINGLMDMERNFKANPDKIREINLRRADASTGLYR